ncbi:MAG: phage major capsid protein [Solirubrobacteraceae bacterium]
MPITEAPGGFGHAITPEQWATYVLEHLSAQSVVLASGATRVTTAQRVVHVPRVLTDGTAAWYNELEEITAGDPTGNELVLTPKKCAAITKLSDESVSDSSPSVLDAVGTAMTRCVALAIDSALLTGAGGKAPVGVYGQAGEHAVSATVTIDSLIDAAGKISAVGGQPRAAYVNPVDHTALMKEKDGNQRPLLTPDYSASPSSSIYGLTIYATPAIAAGTALVAAPEQIVVAVRNDPTVAVSTDAAFTADGAVCRVIARVDVGLNDARGLCSIAATELARSSKK